MTADTNLRRRSLLKVASGALITASPVIRKGRANDSFVEIVTGVYEGTPIATEQVPKKWYNQVTDARIGGRKLINKYSGEPWLVSIGQTAANERINGLSTHKLKIGVTAYDDAPNDLPDINNGIKVDIVEKDTPNKECSTTCSCVKGGSNINVGSNGCTVKDPNLGLGVITAAHGIGDCGDDIQNEVIKSCPVFDPKKIGEVEKWSWNQDVAFAVETSDAAISGLDNEIISATYEVTGHVSEDGIDYMISNGEEAHKYGQKTCHTKGTVKSKSYLDVCGNGISRTFIETGADADTGDSGCPHYRELDNYGIVNVVGIHHGSGVNSYASAAFEINEKLDLEFTNSKTC